MAAADVGQQDRLMPFLLDRLTDDHPTARIEGRERRTFTGAEMRTALLRDLRWLLNSTAQPTGADVNRFDHVAKSVLNYGVSDFNGRASAASTPAYIESLVRQAILNYEPRIRPGSLSVKAIRSDAEIVGQVFAVEIKAEFYDVPLPHHLFLRTEIDLQTNHVSVKPI